MNRKERRALHAIAKNLSLDDPSLADVLRPSRGMARRWIHRFAGWLAVPLLFLGLSLGDPVLLLTGGILAIWGVMGWAVQAVRSDEIDRDRR